MKFSRMLKNGWIILNSSLIGILVITILEFAIHGAIREMFILFYGVVLLIISTAWVIATRKNKMATFVSAIFFLGIIVVTWMYVSGNQSIVMTEEFWINNVISIPGLIVCNLMAGYQSIYND